MKVTYYSNVDMLYIELVQGKSTESEEIAPGVVLDYDGQSRVIGVEIEEASKMIDMTKLELRGLPLADLALRSRASAGD
jgi:uncharacterized protein YuzE